MMNKRSLWLLLFGSVALQPSLCAAQAAPDRVRITVGDVVDLPGVARLGESRTSSVSFLAADEFTVTVTTSDGTAVTLIRPRQKFVGQLVDVDATLLVVRSSHHARIVIPRTAVTNIEHSVRRHRRPWAGMMWGSLGGLGIGTLVGMNCHETGFLACFMQPFASMLFGSIIGAGAGVITGALTVSDDWAPMTLEPVEQLHPSP